MFDFFAATRRNLARKGIEVYGTTLVPGADGSFANGERAYKVSDNGCLRIWSFARILEAAQ